MASAAPLRISRPSRSDPAHPGLGGRRDEASPQDVKVTLAKAVPLLGEDDDLAALRRLVGERGELGRIRQGPLIDPFAPG